MRASNLMKRGSENRFSRNVSSFDRRAERHGCEEIIRLSVKREGSEQDEGQMHMQGVWLEGI